MVRQKSLSTAAMQLIPQTMIKANNDPVKLIPLTLAKSHLRVKTSSEDALIQTYIDGAVAYAEAFCNRVFGYNSYTQTGFAYCDLLGVYPVESITEVAYVPFGETAYTVVDPVDYSLSDWGGLVFRSGYLHPDRWRSDYATKVTYTAGFTAETLPATVRSGILAKVASLYDKRDETAQRYQTSADLYLMTEKVFTI